MVVVVDEEAEEAVAEEEEAEEATQRSTERRTRPWRLMSDAVNDSAASCFARPEEGNCVCETLKAAHRKGAGVSH